MRRKPEPRPGDILGALDELGLLGDARVTGSEVYVLCPYHEDRSPGSFSINVDTGMNSCFSCGNGGSFHRFLMASQRMDRQQARRWCLKRLIATTTPEQHPQKHLPAEPELTEASLALFGYPPGRILAARGISLESCQALQVLWDWKTDGLIFPVRHPHNGKLLGWQEKTRFQCRNYPRNIPVKSCLFGWERVPFAGHVVLVESPVDAAVLYDTGYCAVSSYGAMVSDEQLSLIADRCSSLVLALDDDDAGWKSTDAILHSMHSIPVKVFNYGNHPQGKDPGELTREAIRWGMANLLC